MQDAMLGLTFWEGHVVDSCVESADNTLLIKLAEVPDNEARSAAVV